MIRVIIFDLDGLLVDSQPLQYVAYNQVFTKYGHPITVEGWHAWIDNSYSVTEWIDVIGGLNLDPEVVRSEKKVLYERLIKSDLELKPGVLSRVKTLSKSYSICVASASRMESIRAALEKFGIYEMFEKVISDFDVPRGKPYPDVFLKTAEQMSAHPSECLVIEDSLAGLKAAKSASMKCIICPDSSRNQPSQKFEGADKIVKTLDEITLQTIKDMEDAE
ncbi:HAD family phosphatase [Patescibacteria group bacterium]|nr:HAD family phosphatase [Patescibacteria group bacterium]